MPEPFVVAFVLGVTPGKWARVWGERMPGHPLELRPVSPADGLSALAAGDVDAAFLRLPVDDESLSSIPLYEEQPVVVVPKEHELSLLEEVSPSDLESVTVLDGDWASDVELVAANVGVRVLPHSVARALSRKDVVARAASGAPTTRVALVWRTDATNPLIEEFIGIVRGRTANSSRGSAAVAPEPRAASKRTAKPDPKRSGSGRSPRPGRPSKPRKPKRR